VKRTLAVVGVLSALAAATGGQAQTPPIAAIEAPAHRVILIGDAGGENEKERGMLGPLGRWVRTQPMPTTVVFLGDNYYPKAKAIPDDKIRPILSPQVNVGARPRDVVFVPGNHDWNDHFLSTPDAGRVKALADYASSAGAQWVPADGMGPAELELGDAVKFRLIAIDSEMWLHGDPTDAARELGEMLECAESCLPTILVAHHPIKTDGQHDGYARGVSVLWNWLRRIWHSRQDTHSRDYRNYVLALETAMQSTEASPRPLLLIAAGHDHSLQVHPGPPFSVVSGSGAKLTPVRKSAENFGKRGFMTVDFSKAGNATLNVWIFAELPDCYGSCFANPVAPIPLPAPRALVNSAR
jgi:hypothetical protein